MSAGLVLALLAAAGYGTADFLGGVASRQASAWGVAVLGQVTGCLALLLAALRIPGSPVPSDFGWAVVAGVGSAVGTVFLYRGMTRGRMGVVAPVSAVGAALLPVAVGLALGERPQPLVWLGVALALPGIWLASSEQDTAPVRAGAGARASLADGAVAGVGFGLLFVALGQVPDSAGVLPLAASQAVGVLVTLAAAVALGRARVPRPRTAAVGAVGGAVGATGTLAFATASQAAPLTVVAVLASLYPAVTVLLAAALLRERLTATHGAGIALCLASVGFVAAG